nr:hypothetical protein CFP56_27397 [Quercus suber]
MSKECAKRILFHVEELLSKPNQGQFARTVREGNSVLILQLGSNAHGSFLLVSELDKGRRRVSIVIPEGKLWSGWRSFGVQLRKTIHPLFQNNGVKHRSATFRPVRMMEKVRQISGGFGNKGKEAALDFQNLKSCISWGGIFETDKHQVGVEVTSAINKAENPSANTTLSLENVGMMGSGLLYPLRLRRWASGPQPLATWKPKAQSFKVLGYKAGSPSKHISGETQTSDLVSSDTATRVPEVTPSNAISSFACNFAVQSCVAHFQPSILGCHEVGLGPSPLAGEYASEANSSLSVSYQVLPGSGSLESLPSFAFGTNYGPPISRELLIQPPPSTLGVGSSNLMRDTVRMGSKEGNFESSDLGRRWSCTMKCKLKGRDHVGLEIKFLVPLCCDFGIPELSAPGFRYL